MRQDSLLTSEQIADIVLVAISLGIFDLIFYITKIN